MYLQQNIKTIRKRLKLTLEEFGALFNLSDTTMSYYENGHRQPSLKFLMKLEKLTGITFQEMYSQKVNIIDIPELSSGAMQRRITSDYIEIAQVEEPDSEPYPTKTTPALVNDDPLRAELARIHQLIAEIEARVSSLEKQKGK